MIGFLIMTITDKTDLRKQKQARVKDAHFSTCLHNEQNTK